MNRFQTLFKDPNKKVFIPYFTLGDPTPYDSLNMIKQVVDNGAQALELGMPFTDPVADGPTNQRAMQRALKAGMNFDIALEMITEIRNCYPELPLGLLIYYNLLFRRGLEKAHQELARSGIDAIVCAELPIEESTSHEAILKANNIGCVHMVFPNTSLERAKECIKRSSAFTYVVTRSGITGASEELAIELTPRIKALRELGDSPLVVGFGLSKPQHVKTVLQAGANGAIVASRFADWIEQYQSHLEIAIQNMIDFIQSVQTT